MGGLTAEEGRETKKGLTKKWRGRARRVTGEGAVVAGERASGMVSGGVAGGGWLVGGGG